MESSFSAGVNVLLLFTLNISTATESHRNHLATDSKSVPVDSHAGIEETRFLTVSDSHFITSVEDIKVHKQTSAEEQRFQDLDEMFSDDVPNRPQFIIHLNNCSSSEWISVTGTKGEVVGIRHGAESCRTVAGHNTTIIEAIDITKIELVTACDWNCLWSIRLPREHSHLHLSAVIDITEPCAHGLVIHIYDQEPVDGMIKYLDVAACPSAALSTPVASTTGRLFFKLHARLAKAERVPPPDFTIRFQTTEKSLCKILSAQFTPGTEMNPLTDSSVGYTPGREMNPLAESASGFISTPGFGLWRKRFSNVQASYTLTVPYQQLVMVSYYIRIMSLRCEEESLEVFAVVVKSARKSLFRKCTFGGDPPTEIFNTSLLVEYTTASIRSTAGFKMWFSFHQTHEVPQRLPTGLFNCSVPHYASFKQHVHCNLEPECQGGEDEGEHCPFSPLGCQGMVGYKGKCFFLVKTVKPFPHWRGQDICREKGGDFATVKTAGEWGAVLNYFRYRNTVVETTFALGFKTPNDSMPDIYVRSVVSVDGTVSYIVNTTEQRYFSFDSKHEMYLLAIVEQWPEMVAYAHFAHAYVTHFLCQRYTEGQYEDTSAKIALSVFDTSEILNYSSLSLVPCLLGYLTHDFLSCDAESDCGVVHHVKTCMTPKLPDGVPMFMCENGRDTVHYTLVCDFRRDCGDGSDEAFCQHRQHCAGFRCTSGECVDADRRCDLVRNCLDGSDEYRCSKLLAAVKQYRLPSPAIINFHYGGKFTYTLMNASARCHDTHFQCPGEANYCLPVYVRCNGVFDCAGHEDEADCDSYTCPGYYRCRASSVCVHADHLCDGLPHCPQHDDERFCEEPGCPAGCQCQGLAFVCRQPFPAHTFPNLRYLDAEGSLMSLGNLSVNCYLVWLSLRLCNISSLPRLPLPNLRSLFLDYNKIVTVTTDNLQTLPNLRQLSLEGNPVTVLEADVHTNIEVLMLSHSQLQLTESEQWQGLQQVRILNLSFSRIHTVSKAGFGPLPFLVQLDISGNPLKQFPADLFKDNNRLRTIYAENYRLCCKALLPEGFDENLCWAPRDEVSSCEDLLHSDVYRLCLWAMSLFSILGNSACLAARALLPSNGRSGYPLFVSSLGLADLLMGLFLAVIGVADAVYRSNYLKHEREWTRGGVCQLAGFLALLSSEVSAFTICLITLDRFLVLRFPFSSLRFSRRSAKLGSLVLWVLGAVIAGLPLLPLTSHWEFYSQTGMCLPLPVTRQDFGGRDYALGVMIVLNLVLFLLIAAGQAFIYRSIRANAMTIDNTRTSQDLTIARRLVTVAVSDFLCWFPIGLLGLMASRGFPVPGEVNVAMAILVLPLNSALNPYLYTHKLLEERQRKEYEKQLTRLLESQIVSQEARQLELG